MFERITRLPVGGYSGLVRRLSASTVAWSLAFNCLRLALGVLLLPALLRVLSTPDLGMYYLFLNLSGIVLVLDVGFSPTVGRFVNYAMGGATSLTAQGVTEGGTTGTPNYPLLWDLLRTARVFYRYLALAIIAVLGTFGTWIVWLKAGDTSSPCLTWAAWGVTILAVAAETYFNYWNAYLRNINRVLEAVKTAMLAYSVRLAIALALLLAGGGLLSLPIASLVSSILIRDLSKRQCLKALPAQPPEAVDWRAYFKIIWPNSWRLGLYLASIYLSTNANGLLCSTVLGLEANARYGLSLQIMNIVLGLASVWISVKWPLIGQLVAQRDRNPLRQVLWSRLWLQLGTFVMLAAMVVLAGPALIHLVGKDKQMLPLMWLVFVMVYGVFEVHYNTWGTFIIFWNELPMLWPSLATNAAALAVNVMLVHLPGASAGLLVVGPFVAGAAFTYWFWPRYAARSFLGLGWFQFMVHGFNRKQPAALTLAARS